MESTVSLSSLIYEGVLPYNRVAEALILGSFIVGQSVALAPDYEKGLVAAARITKILNRKPAIDSNQAAGLKLVRFSMIL